MSEKKEVLAICRSAAGLMYLGVLLNRMWYKPILAKSIEEALVCAQNNTFTLVVLDGSVPDEELRSSLQTLKAESSLVGLPFVVLIAEGEPALSDSLLAQGCSAVLTKPLDVTMLYGILARLSGQQRQTHRITVRMRVEIEEALPAPELTCINISEGGLYLRTHIPLPERTLLHLKFTLPKDTEEISVIGEIVRSVPLGTAFDSEPGMGLRFVGLSEKACRQIRNYVQWETAGDMVWEATI